VSRGPLLFKDIDTPGLRSIDTYRKGGGYETLATFGQTSADQVIEVVKASGLRGRGGAGFPTGLKWSFVPKASPKARYIVCNADESEPGTFKDRELMEKNPHLLLEGMILAGYAIGSSLGYIYLRGEFEYIQQIIDKAIAEARAAGLLGENVAGSGYRFDLHTHLGAGAYICGEETALLSSLEGYRGQPRLKPPFPAVEGLYASPTVVNNVETLMNVPYILRHGAHHFRWDDPLFHDRLSARIIVVRDCEDQCRAIIQRDELLLRGQTKRTLSNDVPAMVRNNRGSQNFRGPRRRGIDQNGDGILPNNLFGLG